MPKSGFETVTIKKDTFDHYKNTYEKNKELLGTIGINSFSSFVTIFLDQSISNDEIFTKIVNQITENFKAKLQIIKE